MTESVLNEEKSKSNEIEHLLRFLFLDERIGRGSLMGCIESSNKEEEEKEETETNIFKGRNNENTKRSSWTAGCLALEAFARSSQSSRLQAFRAELCEIIQQHESWVASPSMFFEPSQYLDQLDDSVETHLCENLYDLLISQCMEETEKDNLALQNRLEKLQWLEPIHLEIERVPSELVLSVAREELSRVQLVKSPVEKVRCIVESYRIVAHALRMDSRSNGGDLPGADDLFPIFVLNVCRCGVSNLFAHIRYVENFRSREGLQGEAGYCMCHLQGAATFLMSLTEKELYGVSEEEFKSRMSTTTP